MNQSIVGREGQVTQVSSNGWVNIFINSLKVNEQVQQRYLAHIEPGRVARSIPAHPSGQDSLQQQQPAISEAGLIENFPELPHDLDGFVGGLDGDLFPENSHPMSLGRPSTLLKHEAKEPWAVFCPVLLQVHLKVCLSYYATLSLAAQHAAVIKHSAHGTCVLDN